MLRYVLLYHDCPSNFGRPSHWDLMFESGDVLRTWAIERLPRDWQTAQQKTAANYPKCGSLSPDHVVPVIRLADHRRDYLDLEGPLSGDRGSVVRIASGSYQIESESSDCWRLNLAGREIAGRLRLTRGAADDRQWSLEFGELD